MRNRILLLCIFALLFGACSNTNWEKTSDGILIHLKNKSQNGPAKIRVEVIDEGIMHVIASPTDQFSDEKSLCVNRNDSALIPFDITEVDDTLIISTNRLTARISVSTGVIAFYDQKGNILLKERAKGGKYFTPVTVEETNGYQFTQVFESRRAHSP